MKSLHRIDRALTSSVDALLVIAFSVMLALAALQVLLRFFFHTGIVWGDVAARHLVIYVGFFGAYLATRERKHFRIDALTRSLPRAVRLWSDAFIDLFCAGVCAFLLRASVTFVSVGIDPASVLFLGIPEKYVAAIVPAGFGLILVQFLLRMAESIAQAFQKTPDGGGA